MSRYIGRFAPSPTGPLHAGSLAAALGSWLDARAFNIGGSVGYGFYGRQPPSPGKASQWLVRIEDVDSPRCMPGADTFILGQLAACGLVPDAPPLWQSQRTHHYQQALDALLAVGAVYPCSCSRKDIAQVCLESGITVPRHAPTPYPGTCRNGLHGRPARAWRLRTDIKIQNVPLAEEPLTFAAIKTGVDAHNAAARLRHATLHANVRGLEGSEPAVDSLARNADLLHLPDALRRINTLVWFDRRLGPQLQWVESVVGDFVLLRADGLWAYQLAVVIDDALQGVTHIVRGEDLADNTARQIVLQRALGLPTPTYLHTPLVTNADGQKLSKQNGAQAFDASQPLRALYAAAQVLGLPVAGIAMHGPGNIASPKPDTTVTDALAYWAHAWADLYNPDSAAASV